MGLELVSAPRVISVTNTEASVDVVEEIPYVETTSTTQTGDNLGSNVVEQVAYKEAGIKLKATPTIQDRGILQVEINLELSEVVDSFNNIPIIDSRKLSNTFLVQDGDTIVLGGLMQDRQPRPRRRGSGADARADPRPLLPQRFGCFGSPRIAGLRDPRACSARAKQPSSASTTRTSTASPGRRS